MARSIKVPLLVALRSRDTNSNTWMCHIMLRVSVLLIKDVGKVALEAEMRAVLNQFLQEIQKIEDFYLKMSSQYLQEFEDLKQRMQIKNRDDLLPA